MVNHGTTVVTLWVGWYEEPEIGKPQSKFRLRCLPTRTFFDDRQPGGEKPEEKPQIFLKLLATHAPSLTYREEGLALYVLAGTLDHRYIYSLPGIAYQDR